MLFLHKVDLKLKNGLQFSLVAGQSLDGFRLTDILANPIQTLYTALTMANKGALDFTWRSEHQTANKLPTKDMPSSVSS